MNEAYIKLAGQSPGVKSSFERLYNLREEDLMVTKRKETGRGIMLILGSKIF